jgi:hypothetical protein
MFTPSRTAQTPAARWCASFSRVQGEGSRIWCEGSNEFESFRPQPPASATWIARTLRDWVHRFNQHGPEGLTDIRSKGHPPRLSAAQQAELADLVETGPHWATHGVVRWRRIDLKQIIAKRFGVVYHERTVGKAGFASEKILLANPLCGDWKGHEPSECGLTGLR